MQVRQKDTQTHTMGRLSVPFNWLPDLPYHECNFCKDNVKNGAATCHRCIIVVSWHPRKKSSEGGPVKCLQINNIIFEIRTRAFFKEKNISPKVIIRIPSRITRATYERMSQKYNYVSLPSDTDGAVATRRKSDAFVITCRPVCISQSVCTPFTYIYSSVFAQMQNTGHD